MTNRSMMHALWLLGAFGCSGAEKTAAAENPVVEGPGTAQVQAAAAKPAEPPKPAIEETSFRLAFEAAQPYAAGQPGTLKVVLQPRNGYHVNQDYPVRIDLTAPGVKLAKPSLGKADAAAFGEQSASWDLGFTADKGSHDVAATVDFAVCTPDTCLPDRRTIAIALQVQ